MTFGGMIGRLTRLLHELAVNLVAGCIQNWSGMAVTATLTAASVTHVITRRTDDRALSTDRLKAMKIAAGTVCAVAGALTYNSAIGEQALPVYAGSSSLLLWFWWVKSTRHPLGLADVISTAVLAPTFLILAFVAWRLSFWLSAMAGLTALVFIVLFKLKALTGSTFAQRQALCQGGVFIAVGLVAAFVVDPGVGLMTIAIGALMGLIGLFLRCGWERAPFVALTVLGAAAAVTLESREWAAHVGSVTVAAAPMAYSAYGLGRACRLPHATVVGAIMIVGTSVAEGLTFLVAHEMIIGVGLIATAAAIGWALWIDGPRDGWRRRSQVARHGLIAAARSVLDYLQTQAPTIGPAGKIAA